MMCRDPDAHPTN
jgi:hypothetical protein